MTIKPLSDRVVIKLVEAEEKTKTGITTYYFCNLRVIRQ